MMNEWVALQKMTKAKNIQDFLMLQDIYLFLPQSTLLVTQAPARWAARNYPDSKEQ